MKKILFILISVSIFLSGCFSYVARYDGSYKGKIIDVDTGEPIEGVVVLGVWNKGYPTPGGTVHEFYDARETLTDKNGEFAIPGVGLRVMSNLEPMDVVIFKAGYEHIGYMQWESLKEDILLRKKIKWEGDMAIIPLKKWTLEERRNRFGDYYVAGMPDEKRRLLLKEIEKEDREIGK